VEGVPVPFEDAFRILAGDAHTFDRSRFPLDLPATAFFKPRTFQITEVTPGNLSVIVPPPGTGAGSGFPAIDPDDKGNVIPLILRDPFGPSNSSGEIIRIDQAELDAAFASNPPQLPAAIEANFTTLINAGLLAPEWAPGGRPLPGAAGAGRARRCSSCCEAGARRQSEGRDDLPGLSLAAQRRRVLPRPLHTRAGHRRAP
jgi:hypothetical protein